MSTSTNGMHGRLMWLVAFDAAIAEKPMDDTSPYVTVDGVSYCHDCEHEEAKHTISDPNGDLYYGNGNCGNCTTCEEILS